MSLLVVGVGECRVSAESADEIVTYALGSCIALVVWDPVLRAGGLLHFMLPEAGAASGQAAPNPYRYADTGTPLLFRSLYGLGSDKRRLLIRAAGGAAVVDDGGLFEIGRRNHAALRRILWRAGVMLHAEDVGGRVSRTVRLEVSTGRMTVRHAAGPETELAPRVRGEGQLRG